MAFDKPLDKNEAAALKKAERIVGDVQALVQVVDPAPTAEVLDEAIHDLIIAIQAVRGIPSADTTDLRILLNRLLTLLGARWYFSPYPYPYLNPLPRNGGAALCGRDLPREI